MVIAREATRVAFCLVFAPSVAAGSTSAQSAKRYKRLMCRPRSLDDSLARSDWSWQPLFDLERMTYDMLRTTS